MFCLKGNRGIDCNDCLFTAYKFAPFGAFNTTLLYLEREFMAGGKGRVHSIVLLPNQLNRWSRVITGCEETRISGCKSVNNLSG